MNVSPIIQNYQNIQFNGNTNPKAILAKQKELIKELNIDTGTSFTAELLRMPQNEKHKDFWNNLFQKLKENIPIADTVEKLELLKSYGTSLLGYTQENISKFLRFLKSKPTDKDVYFLQTAMNIARKGEEEKLKNGKEHYIFNDFEPVLDYVLSNKKERVDFARWSMQHIDRHINGMKSVHRKNTEITDTDSNTIVPAIHELLSNKYQSQCAYYSHHNYGTISIPIKDGYLNIGAIDVNGNTEITVGHSVSKEKFYNDSYDVPPIKRQLFLLLDKDKKLSKLKLFSYSEFKDSKYSNDDEYYVKKSDELRKSCRIFLNRYESPFGDRIPQWVRYGYNGEKYRLRTIEYDAKTKTAELKHYQNSSAHYPEKFKLVDTKSDELGIMTDKNNPISFIPVEPTAYDLEQMINNEKTNNLIKVLDFSSWKEPFMKIISESLKA